MAEIKKSSGNVFADLGLPDAEKILIKARLAAKIGEIIKQSCGVAASAMGVNDNGGADWMIDISLRFGA